MDRLKTLQGVLPNSTQFLVSLGVWYIAQAIAMDTDAAARVHHLLGAPMLFAMAWVMHRITRNDTKEDQIG